MSDARTGAPAERIPLSDTEATAMLARLRRHYGEPVLRLSAVCNAVGAAFRCWTEEVQRNPTSWMASRAPHLNQILTDIRKSALLGRLLYDGQRVRTPMCPLHLGKQDMHIHLGMEPQCQHGCDGTGWLREPGDGDPTAFGPFLVTVSAQGNAAEPPSSDSNPAESKGKP